MPAFDESFPSRAPLDVQPSSTKFVSLEVRHPSGPNELDLLQAEILLAEIHLQHLKQEHHETLGVLQEVQSQLMSTEKLATLGQMVAGVAHEINNPLNYISGSEQNLRHELKNFSVFLRNLLGEDADSQEAWGSFEARFEKMEEMLNDVRHGIQRMREINQALRNYTRLDHEMQSHLELAPILQEALVILEGRTKRHRIEAHLEELPRFRGHRSHLTQVLTNLIANASDAIHQKIEHLKEQGQRNYLGKITILAQAEARLGIPGFFIRIEDNGSGILPEHRSQIFRSFFTTKASEEGTGLGLAVSRQIIRDHGGTLELLASSDGGGACFEVWLPQNFNEFP